MSDPNAATKRLVRPLFRVGGELDCLRLGFGAMRVAGQPGAFGEPADRGQAIAVLRAAYDSGVRLFDTADAYGPFVSETLIAEALHPYGPGVVIATKGGLERPDANSWRANGRPEHLRAACEASLRRLRLERLDLYQLHAVDPQVPFEESVGALFDLQREGKIRLIGLSNVSLEQLHIALKCGRIATVQNHYSVLRRQDEPMVAFCESQRIGYMPWGPLAEGSSAQHQVLRRIGERSGATATQVALAWLLTHSQVILPIPGTSSLVHLQENVGARTLELTTDDMAELDALA